MSEAPRVGTSGADESAATPLRSDPDVASISDDDTIDLDAIERDLDHVERALGELADGTYWERAEARSTAADR